MSISGNTDFSIPLIQEAEIHQDEEKVSEYRPYRVFINHVDSYNSRYISSYISDQIYGTLRLRNDELGAGEQGEGEELPPKPIGDNQVTDKYEFIGTLSTPFRNKSEDILLTIQHSNKENFHEEIMKCGFIIYDITKNSGEISKALDTLNFLVEELERIRAIGPKTYENFKEVKIFVLISTIMTWALTKPLDPDDPDLPFSEVDYKKRRPHPNYKEHYNCEKEVIKVGQKYKDKLKTYVLCCGFPYGEEEEDLQYFFRMAWYNEKLPIFSPGNNIIPLIYIKDLARALHGLMENAPVKPQYVLAVEQTPSTLKQIIRSLSKALGDGRTALVIAEEAFLYRDMTQKIFEKFTVNLNMEPVFLVENLQLQWQNEASLPENMNQIVREFKKSRNMKPVKIILHGPPGSGKTRLAKKLCDYYKTHYVSVETMLRDCLNIWKESLIKPEKVPGEEMLGEEEEMEEEIEEEEDPQQIQEQIRETEIMLENGLENISDEFVTGIMKTFLAKNLCQNRGYVLDDYPRLIHQAKELFGHAAEAGGEEEEADSGDIEKILPDIVISLQGTDEFICDRIMKLPEDEIKDTPYEEEKILARLEEFRKNNTEDNTVLNYFDELEVEIMLHDITEDDNLQNALAIVTKKFGLPLGFGLSPEEEEELYRIEEEQRRLAAEAEELNRQLLLEKAEQERKERMEGWIETLEKLQREEEKILIAQSEPLRHYLMKFVFPTLTKGLIELATIKPEDPVDFLAEYLFKENPEGRMFDPSYNEEGEELYTEFKRDIEKIIENHEEFEK